ncbi:MAG: hypothetical protein KDK27_20150 [Leptospiraceae bacterium]|nr:hypothetical protein [Leptospiraceae bacterium]
MRSSFIYAVIVAQVLLLASILHAQPRITTTERSGSIEDADMESPLDQNDHEKLALLETSNRIIELLIANEIDLVFNQFFSDALKAELSLADLRSLYANLIASCGRIESYRPMQWYFIRATAENAQDIASLKIVHHEKALIYYEFTFNRDEPTKLIGFWMHVKEIYEEVKPSKYDESAPKK